MKKFKTILFACSLTVFALASCKKNNDKTSTFQIRLTDAPTSLEEVNVEIREVDVRIRETTRETPATGTIPETRPETEGWVRMETNGRVYNLLELQNGVNEVLATADLPTGVVEEIRLILGTNNSVRENGVVSPLVIPSGSTSGLKIKVDKALNASLETITIDFDAALSVKKEGDRDFKLRPVIKLK
ncbi:MAG: DUF4382 domain-containing protein [Ferruginibacter sp.]